MSVVQPVDLSAAKSCPWPLLHRRASRAALLSTSREHNCYLIKELLWEQLATSSWRLIQELQRGYHAAHIYCINFSQDACSSVCLVTMAQCTFFFCCQRSEKGINSIIWRLPISWWNTSAPNEVYPNFRFPQSLNEFCAFGTVSNTVISICTKGSYYTHSYPTSRRSTSGIFMCSFERWPMASCDLKGLVYPPRLLRG